MVEKLHIDIETYSSVDLAKSGVYKYTESLDFEILMIAYAFDSNPVQIIDLAQGEQIPQRFIQALQNENIKKCAHNAAFERLSFKAIGYDIPVRQWRCSMIKAAYCGLPLSLEDISKALKLEDKGKDVAGKALIRYFCQPVKPTKTNGGRVRNFYDHDLDKWKRFRMYCKQDVEAEREVDNELGFYKIPKTERELYFLDQKINDAGVKLDIPFIKNAISIADRFTLQVKEKIKSITGVENPGSVAQLKTWLSQATGKHIESLAKDKVKELIIDTGVTTAGEVLALRQKSSKSSNKKYPAMLNCGCQDGRARGLFQFYGANRTGRWAGRLVQLQNLPQNHLEDLDLIRNLVRGNKYTHINMMFDNISQIISELIRTAFIAPEGKIFAVADFSAIEARVTAWLAGEDWRLEVFKTHGKIYEASAAMMFNVDIDEVTKGSDYRAKGKVAELALGFGGAVGALEKMGGEKMGLSRQEMTSIVKVWRGKNKNITQLWKNLEGAAKRALRSKNKTIICKNQNLEFLYDGKFLSIKLPSGRKLFYRSPSFTVNRFGGESIKYMGMNQETKKWSWTETYGGKLTENVVQAISRDLLAEAMLRLDRAKYKIVIHVHDEPVCEIDLLKCEDRLSEMCAIMCQNPNWAKDLPLNVDGYLTLYYKKD